MIKSIKRNEEIMSYLNEGGLLRWIITIKNRFWYRTCFLKENPLKFFITNILIKGSSYLLFNSLNATPKVDHPLLRSITIQMTLLIDDHHHSYRWYELYSKWSNKAEVIWSLWKTLFPPSTAIQLYYRKKLLKVLHGQIRAFEKLICRFKVFSYIWYIPISYFDI